MNMVIPRLVLAVICTGLAAGCSSPARSTPAPPADLQVQVDVPPLWRPIVNDDVAEALAGILRDRFRRAGYQGRILYLAPLDEAAPNRPLLTLALTEWRLSRTGNAECLFTARLRTSAGETDLGMFSSTQFAWVRESGRIGALRAYAVADALEDAAGDAMRDLYRRLADTGQVPGLSRR